MGNGNKKILAVGGVSVVLAGWFGASMYAGSVAEREIRAFAARPSSETGVRVRNLQHNAGLLSATLELAAERAALKSVMMDAAGSPGFAVTPADVVVTAAVDARFRAS